MAQMYCTELLQEQLQRLDVQQHVSQPGQQQLQRPPQALSDSETSDEDQDVIHQEVSSALQVSDALHQGGMCGTQLGGHTLPDAPTCIAVAASIICVWQLQQVHTHTHVHTHAHTHTLTCTQTYAHWLPAAHVMASSALPASLLQPLMRIQQSFCLADPRLPDCPIIHASAEFLRMTGYTRQVYIPISPRALDPYCLTHMSSAAAISAFSMPALAAHAIHTPLLAVHVALPAHPLCCSLPLPLSMDHISTEMKLSAGTAVSYRVQAQILLRSLACAQRCLQSPHRQENKKFNKESTCVLYNCTMINLCSAARVLVGIVVDMHMTVRVQCMHM